MATPIVLEGPVVRFNAAQRTTVVSTVTNLQQNATIILCGEERQPNAQL
jgi:hypothetical protein